MQNLKRNNTTKLAYKTETDPQTENKLMVMEGKGWGGIVREFGITTYTLLYLKQITNKVLLYSTGRSAQCYEAVWMEKEFGGEWIHVYV